MSILPGFSYLGRSVTPTFLLMDHFLYRFVYVQRKNEENLSTRSLNFLQNASSNSVQLSSSFFSATASNVSCKTLAKRVIIYASDTLLLRLEVTDVDHAVLRAPICQNQGNFPHAVSLKRSRWSRFFCISDTSISLSDCRKILKKLSTGKFSCECAKANNTVSNIKNIAKGY